MSAYRRLAAPLTLALAASFAVAACSDDGTPPADSGPSDGDGQQSSPSHCNPLSGVECMLPWPSSFYLAADANSKTGYRVAYPSAAMPQSKSGVPVDPARYNLLDGFSPATSIIAAFKKGVSPAGLPPIDDIASSVSDSSLVWLYDVASGERVPLFAEADANAQKGEQPGLAIRPQRHLGFNKRLIVVLRKGIKDASGADLEVPEPFAKLRDGQGDLSPTLEKLRAPMKEVFDFLAAKNIDNNDVLLAWDFRTASEDAVVTPLVDMVSEALAKLPASGPAYTISESTDYTAAQQPRLLRAIVGTFEVPSFFESDDPDAVLGLDANGRPEYRAMQRFGFRINIPRCAESRTGPLPVLLFGHGIFGSPEIYLAGQYSDYHKLLSERLCMVEVATRWLGLSEPDLAAVAKIVVPDLSKLPRVTDQLRQAHVNQQVLVKLLESSAFVADKALEVGGQPVTDAANIYYIGISLGGIQGPAFASLNKDITRYVFNVGGGVWSQMLERSSDFKALAALLKAVYPRAIDRLLLYALTQSQWDYTDPVNFAARVLKSPPAGHPTKHVIYQEARHDDQVPNHATRIIVRSLGLPLLTPKNEAVYGVEDKPAPLDSAYVQWDTNPPKIPPKTNTPADPLQRPESAHYAVRELESCLSQLEAFFKPDGKVLHTCSGPCGKQ